MKLFVLLLLPISLIWAQCTVDFMEPNNRLDGGSNITLPFTATNLTLCNSNVDPMDVFQFYVNSSGVLNVQVSFRTGDMDIYLFQNNGVTSIGTSDTANSLYEFLVISVGPGLYQLQISPYTDTNPNQAYTLKVFLTPNCDADQYEPNNVVAQAKTLPLSASIYSLNLCGTQADEDWFTFTVTFQTIIHISVNFVTFPGDIDVFLIASNATILSQSDTTKVNSPALASSVVDPGTYFVRVWQDFTYWVADTPYSLVVNGQTIYPATSAATSNPSGASSVTNNPTIATTISSPTVFSSAEITATSQTESEAPIKKSSGGDNNTSLLVGVVLGVIAGLVVLLVIVLVIVLFVFKRQRRNPTETRPQVIPEQPAVVPFSGGYDRFKSSSNPSQQPSREGIQLSDYNIPKNVPAARLDKNFCIDFRELGDMVVIGKGSYGIVYRAKWRETTVAVKMLQADMDEKGLNDFVGEANILSSLRPHPNVVLFMGITYSPQPISIVTEFCACGSLYNFIHSDAKISNEDQYKILLGIVRGMIHLHSENIIHRDLASRNVLLTENFDVKVSDFGLSRQNSEDVESNKTRSEVGPLKWMAPEAIKEKIYGVKSDSYSFGVVVWEVVCRSDPYPDMDAVKVAMSVCYEGLKPPIPSSCDPLLAEVMQKCWQRAPTDRPTFKEIYNMIDRQQVRSSIPQPRSNPGSRQSANQGSGDYLSVGGSRQSANQGSRQSVNQGSGGYLPPAKSPSDADADAYDLLPHKNQSQFFNVSLPVKKNDSEYTAMPRTD